MSTEADRGRSKLQEVQRMVRAVLEVSLRSLEGRRWRGKTSNMDLRTQETGDGRLNGDSTGTACDADSCSGCSWLSNSARIEDIGGGGGGTVKNGGDVYVFSFSVSVSVSASVSISVFVSMSGSSFVVGRTEKGSKSV